MVLVGDGRDRDGSPGYGKKVGPPSTFLEWNQWRSGLSRSAPIRRPTAPDLGERFQLSAINGVRQEL